MNMFPSLNPPTLYDFLSIRPANRQAVVMIVSEMPETILHVQSVCEFFDLGVEVVLDGMDLAGALAEVRPMAVVADLDGGDKDGFYVMKLVAEHDRDLPMMLLTGGDPIMMGAADAVQELWGLSAVTRSTDEQLAGQMADFLFTAGRRAGCMRLVPV